MIISLNTITPGYSLSLRATVQDGFNNLTPATGGGICADGTFAINYYAVSSLGKELKFNLQLSRDDEQTFIFLAKNYQTFRLTFDNNIYVVSISSFNFGTGNDDITFIILED